MPATNSPPRDRNGEVILVLDTNDDDERKLFGSVEDLGQIVSSSWAMPSSGKRIFISVAI